MLPVLLCNSGMFFLYGNISGEWMKALVLHDLCLFLLFAHFVIPDINGWFLSLLNACCQHVRLVVLFGECMRTKRNKLSYFKFEINEWVLYIKVNRNKHDTFLVFVCFFQHEFFQAAFLMTPLSRHRVLIIKTRPAGFLHISSTQLDRKAHKEGCTCEQREGSGMM